MLIDIPPGAYLAALGIVIAACIYLYLENVRLRQELEEANSRLAATLDVFKDVIRAQMAAAYTEQQRDVLVQALLKVGTIEKSIHVSAQTATVASVGTGADVGQIAVGADIGQDKTA